MPTVNESLRVNSRTLAQAGIQSARLDAEVLLSYCLGVERSWLHAHGDEELENARVRKFESLVKRRLEREPVAYIVGKKEFYGREFIVTPDVLVPRPETEDLVELVLELKLDSDKVRKLVSSNESEESTKILDIGCGSGCIGITLKFERPELDVTLVDISPSALKVAEKNAKNLKANVNIIQSNLLSSFKIPNPKSKIFYDLIAANLPYVDKYWRTSPETNHEPAEALYAENGGLELIYKLIKQSPSALKSNGYLLLEADPAQHADIISYASRYGFQHQIISGYALALKLVD